MLQIIIPASEGFDEEASEFITSGEVTIDLEHSLVSLSKWESKWEKPFLGFEQKTEDQTRDYIKMMILGEIPPEEILASLTIENIKEIDTYINAKMSATWFNEPENPKPGRETVTAELIYYWMISLGIPFECQEWHLNRLLTLIRVCNHKNAPKKKMSPAETRSAMQSLNQQRRAATGSKG